MQSAPSIKPFDIQLYNQNDSQAKKRLAEIVMGKSFTIVEPEDIYTVDFYVLRNGIHVGNFETEIKHGWRNATYPFSDVRFPCRKEKFAKLLLPTVFIMFNDDLTQHLGVKSSRLLASPITVINNIEMNNEAFFSVNLSDVHFNWLDRWK